jgi:hypothetical protein
VTRIQTYCDHMVVSYLAEEDDAGTYKVEAVVVSTGHVAGDKNVTVTDFSTGNVVINYDREYPAGTVFQLRGYSGTQPETFGDASCGGDPDVTWFEPGDNRINRQANAYAAIYCDDANQRVTIYGIHSPGAQDLGADNPQQGSGFPALFVSYADLPAIPTAAQGNQLIDQYENIRLYKLTTGELQVNVGPDPEGKEYVLIWDNCPSSYVQAYIFQNGVMTQTEVYPSAD